MSDLIGVIEAAYDASSVESDWLTRIADVARPLLDHGVGALVWSFSPDANGAPSPRVSGASGMDEARIASFWQSCASDEDRLALAQVYARPVNTIRIELGERFDALEVTASLARETGVVDVLSVNARNPSGSGVTIGVPLPRPIRLSPAVERRWSRVAAHLAAGLRLRALESADVDGSYAVLTPGGRIEHAEGDARDEVARESLRNAAVAIDRARGSLRRSDTEAALEQWAALVCGRWTLVDSFDSDGRRHVIAKPNVPSAPGPSTLTLRERQICALRAAGHPLKLIAYELGISISTVARCLGSASTKLGTRSSVDLARAFRAG